MELGRRWAILMQLAAQSRQAQATLPFRSQRRRQAASGLAPLATQHHPHADCPLSRTSTTRLCAHVSFFVPRCRSLGITSSESSAPRRRPLQKKIKNRAPTHQQQAASVGHWTLPSHGRIARLPPKQLAPGTLFEQRPAARLPLPHPRLPPRTGTIPALPVVESAGCCVSGTSLRPALEHSSPRLRLPTISQPPLPARSTSCDVLAQALPYFVSAPSFLHRPTWQATSGAVSPPKEVC